MFVVFKKDLLLNRFASYTAPVKLHDAVSVSIEQSTSLLKPSSSSKLGLTSRISPMNSKSPINKTNMATGKTNLNGTTITGTTPRVVANSSINKEEKADNRKNESMEKKKKDEKIKIKAEKDARKVRNYLYIWPR